MKYCPECEAEYRDEIEACADCQVPLISAEAYEKRKREEQEQRERLRREVFVPVKIAETPIEAERIRSFLEQEGLTVLVRTFEDTAYDGIYVAQKGWGAIEVPEDEKERAERLVEEMDRAFSEGEGD